jgi:hypothetical protein
MNPVNPQQCCRGTLDPVNIVKLYRLQHEQLEPAKAHNEA